MISDAFSLTFLTGLAFFEMYMGPTPTNYIVQTTYGPVQGKLQNGERNTTFYSFQGIPYAQPPVGDLRFKDPKPPVKWTETYDATREGPNPYGIYFNGNRIVSDAGEDCLTLNVFTNSFTNSKKSPVMLWLFGGCFTKGLASQYIFGPDYFIKKGVVVVTANFRLGALGFLSIDDPEFDIPGNAGLKDQSLALQWVRQNIAAFGGDPTNITFFGVSSGAASIHYHLMSPMSKGLFDRAILQSGSAFSPWAITPRFDLSARLAKRLGWDGTGGTAAMLTVLKAAKPEDIVQHQDVNTLQEKQNGYFFGFVPVIEPYDLGNSFIAMAPVELSKSAWGNRVPVLTGGNSGEGYLFFLEFKTDVYNPVDRSFMQNILPREIIDPMDSPKRVAYAQALQKFYLNDTVLNSKNADLIVPMFSDRFIWQGIVEAVTARVANPENAPTYLYRFSFESRSFVYLKQKYLGTDAIGAVHGEELMYLWSVLGISSTFRAGTIESEVMDRLQSSWVNFATTGNPNSEYTMALNWMPVQQNGNSLKCLDFGTNNTYIDLPEQAGSELWISLCS